MSIKNPDALHIANHLRNTTGADATIAYLRTCLVEKPASLDSVVALVRELRLAGRVAEARLILRNMRCGSYPPWFLRGLQLESVFISALMDRPADAFAEMKDYVGPLDERIESLWIRVTRELARTLDLDRLDRWLAATVEDIRSCANDKLRADRYIELIKGPLRNQVALWEQDPSIRAGDAIITPVKVRDNLVTALQDVTDLSGLFLAGPDEIVGMHFELGQTLPPRFFGKPDLAGRQQSMSAKLGSGSELRPLFGQLFSLPKARFVEFNQDNRGGIICAGNVVIRELCNEHQLLDIAGHCKVLVRTARIPLAYAPVAQCPGNYYHDVIDSLGSLLPYCRAGLTEPIVLPRKTRVVMSLLEVLGLQSENVFTYEELCSTEIGRLIVPAAFPHSSKVVAFLRDLGLAALKRGRPSSPGEGGPAPEQHSQDTVAPGSLVYLSRRKAIYRKLLNELEIEELLKERGFSIVCAEDLSIVEQISLMRNTRVLVTPHGAGLTNMVFSPPGLTIMELLPDGHLNSLFARLAAACEHVHLPLVGSALQFAQGVESGWYFEVETLKAVVDLYCDRPAPQ